MAGKFGEIEVDGLKEFNRAVRQAADKNLGKRMGQANKAVGSMVVSKLQPRPDAAAVGAGAGASVRPSASKREVLLRVGGKHRAGHAPYMQWGRRPGPLAFRRRPKRPYIRETVDRHEREIMDTWLKAISQAMAPAFHSTEP